MENNNSYVYWRLNCRWNQHRAPYIVSACMSRTLPDTVWMNEKKTRHIHYILFVIEAFFVYYTDRAKVTKFWKGWLIWKNCDYDVHRWLNFSPNNFNTDFFPPIRYKSYENDMVPSSWPAYQLHNTLRMGFRCIVQKHQASVCFRSIDEMEPYPMSQSLEVRNKSEK